MHVVLGGSALVTVVTVAGLLGPALALDLDLCTPPVAARWTVFTAVVVQGIPFLLLGTLVSAAIGAFVPERVFTRLLPRSQALAVPVAGAAETGTWVTATGTWRPEGELGSPSAWPPVLDATTVVRVAEPSDPYEER
ncbi:hypothetical protein [Streptomyces sp. NPDC048737]|uniref:hypothetical protein n=1 Tax=Streptomyces sp. NPDC048737 TaxID=3155764 RepID=UPI00344245C7